MTTEVTPTWFRVVGAGLSGPARRTEAAAWNAYQRAGKRAFGYEPHQQGTSVAAHSARLACGTTRRAVDDADPSKTRGRVGRGEWWIN